MSLTTDRVGIWTSQLGFASADQLQRTVADLERAGFTSLWTPESTWVDPFVLSALALSATQRMKVCIGVARIHGRAPQTMVNAWSGLSAWYPQRFVLGLGVSHRPAVESMLGVRYEAPLDTMRQYLQQIDEVPFDGLEPVARHRVLAALGPKMLTLSKESSDGAHPYQVPVEHTRFARQMLGTGPLLIPEVKVLFEKDAKAARTIARRQIGRSLRLSNYARNLARFGFSEEEISQSADPVIDALVGWGSDDDVVRRIEDHLAAGADQVAVQVLGSDPDPPVEQWQRLARALQ